MMEIKSERTHVRDTTGRSVTVNAEKPTSRILKFILLIVYGLVPLALCLLLALTGQAQNNPGVRLNDIGIDQRLDVAVPLDLTFLDETGRSVALRDYFRGRPVILTLVYYECPMLCTEILNGLVGSLRVLSFNAGDQFDIITVSFNPRDTPALAAAKKAAYLERYARPGAARGWHFLTGDAASINALTQAVGFRYVYDPRTDQYAHAGGIMVLTPRGKISRYFYGIEYAPRDLRLGLVEASANKIGSPVDRLLLLCYHYDPAQGKYGAVVINFIRLGGGLTILGLVGFIFISLRRDWKQRHWKTGGVS